MTQRIGLLIATPSEIPAFWPRPKAGALAVLSFAGGSAGPLSAGLLISGIGQARACAAASRLCDQFRPDILCSFGVCGSAQPGLGVGDVVIGQAVTCGDGEIGLAGDVFGLLEGGPAALTRRLGKIETVDRVALDRRRLRRDALAADMECYAVASVGQRAGLPVAAVKAVSDVIPEKMGMAPVAGWLLHLRGGLRGARQSLELCAALCFGTPSTT